MRRIPRIWKASVAAIAIILTIQACVPISVELLPAAYRLVISAPQRLKYDEIALAKALKSIQHSGVSYDFHLVSDTGRSKDFHYTSPIAIKTDRVITTELAKSLSQGEYTPIGSSITHHLNTPVAADIGVVLNQIKK